MCVEKGNLTVAVEVGNLTVLRRPRVVFGNVEQCAMEAEIEKGAGHDQMPRIAAP